MNIAFCLPDFRGGGAEKVIISIANEISKRNNLNVFIFSGIKSGDLLYRVNKDIKVVELGETSGIKNALSIARICNQFDIDIIIGTLGMAHAVSISKVFGNKSLCIARIGNTVSQDLTRWSGIKKNIMKLYQNVLVFSDLIITQSDFMTSDLRTSVKLLKNKKNIYRIYNPIDLEYAVKKSNELNDIHCTSADFITIGRLEWQKDTSTIIKAFYEYNKTMKGSRLHILGSGSEKVELELLVKELNLCEDVIFHGFVSNPYPYIKKCKAFIMASRFEGFSNSILEAIALEAKVIVTDCPGGNREIITHHKNGLMFPIGNEHELCNHMLNIDEFIPVFSEIEQYKLKNVVSLYLNLICRR